MSALAESHSTQSELVLRALHLGKEYKLYASPRDRLKALVTGRAYHTSHWALRDVSFELRRGQSLGVIGDNGAGKSSLLKLMAGTLQPSTGAVQRMGRVTAILELGAGFHPEFTGRDNLYFSGSLIGISNAEMASLEQEVIAFSELGPAIDRPVKTYSSGMTVRLAFALVTAVQPDLLIIDEALAVGDQHFQKKCVERIAQFRNNGCTILFCSHSLYHVRHLCDTTLWLDKGQVKAFGETETVLASYGVHVRAQDPTADSANAAMMDSQATPQTATLDAPKEPHQQAQVGSKPEKRAELVSVEIADLGAGTPPLLESNDLVVTVTSRISDDEQPSIAVMLEQVHGVGITAVATHVDGVIPTRLASGEWRTTVTFSNLPLHSSDYVVSAYLFDSRGLVVYDEWMKHTQFRWIAPSRLPGLVHLPHHWS